MYTRYIKVEGQFLLFNYKMLASIIDCSNWLGLFIKMIKGQFDLWLFPHELNNIDSLPTHPSVAKAKYSWAQSKLKIEYIA